MLVKIILKNVVWFYQERENWNKLKQKEKEIIMQLPNFDPEIFKQITGIDVGELTEKIIKQGDDIDNI